MANISLKNFFDAIRGRYNDEANKVEVTGSKVEIVNDGNTAVSIPAGSYTSVSIEPAYDYRQVEIGFREENNESFPLRVRVEPRTSAGSKMDDISLMNETNFRGSFRNDAIGERVLVIFNNDDTVSRSIVKYVAGVR
ncbi:hypothetical protein [Gracilibacillus sp. YIM 98692]|uniref:hypothetical protein n=1 Tax=Gracilibacillus sp. YIM 98692 TaxID=2663532 RepID=UPI0013D5DEF3|nr:hypothetical protein [Gracilibacillus sp. YIM 98692]